MDKVRRVNLNGVNMRFCVFVDVASPPVHCMASIDALIGALNQYEGTLIYVSHDVHFIRSISNHVVRVDAGHLHHFPGGYDYYLTKIAATSAQAALIAGTRVEKEKIAPEDKPSFKSREQKRLEAEERQARSRERKAQNEIVQKLEKEILKLETRQKELTTEMERPETYEKSGYAVKLNRELTEITEKLAALSPQWEVEAAKLMEIDNK